MDDGARLMAVDPLHPELIHQLGIAGRHLNTIHHGGHAVSADLPDIRHTASVDLSSVCPLQASAHGMRGSALRQRGILEKLLSVHLIVMDFIYLQQDRK